MQPKEILERWSEGRDFSRRYRNDYWLNHEYVAGRQWVTVDERSGLPHQMINPDRRIRETYDRMGPNNRTLLGKFVGQPLKFDVTPGAADDHSLRGARTAEHAIQQAADIGNWETKRSKEVQYLLLGGACLAVLDPSGPDMEMVSGKPAPMVAELSIYNLPSFVAEPGALCFSEARWFMTCRGLPPGKVKEHYGLKADPKADSMAVHQNLAAERSRRPMKENLASLYVMYEKPPCDRSGKRVGKGRVIHCTQTEILLEEDWPYPFDGHPAWCFMSDDSSDTWLGETFYSATRKTQDSLNFLRTQQSEATRAMVPKLAVPTGFDIEQLNDDPASPYIYDPMGQGGDGAPKWISGDSGTLRLRYDIEAAVAQIDEMMHIHDIARGVAGERASGSALAILSENDETPLSSIARDQQQGWSHLATCYLKIAEKAITKDVLATIRVGRSTVEVVWNGKMLANQTNVTVPLQSTQPFSRAARNKTIIDAMQMLPGVFDTLTGIQKIALLDLPELPSIGELLDPDVEKAQRENHYMSADVPCVPARDEDHTKHLAEHRAFTQSAAFAALTPEAQELVLKHVRVHDRLLEEEVVSQRMLNEDMPGASALPSSLNMIGQVGPESQPIPYR